MILLLSIAACSDITALPHGSERFEPPPVYQRWWEMTEACSGRTGKLSDIEWYVVPGAEWVSEGTGEYDGIWSPGRNSIVLTGDSQMEGSLVRHEMLHALLYGGGHPRSLFLGTCGGVVACVEQCIQEAGPPATPAANTPRVSPDSLEIGLEIVPAEPSRETLGGYFTLTVTAHNPASHAVVVLLPPSGDARPSVTFTWSMSNDELSEGWNARAYDPEMTYFAAGETKQQVFDLRVGASPTEYDALVAGTYTAVGAYGGHTSMARQVTLSP